MHYVRLEHLSHLGHSSVPLVFHSIPMILDSHLATSELSSQVRANQPLYLQISYSKSIMTVHMN